LSPRVVIRLHFSIHVPSDDPSSNIFSLGVILCEAATGASPAQLNLIAVETTPSSAPTPPDALTRWESLSPMLRQLLVSLLNVDPSARPTAAVLVSTVEKHAPPNLQAATLKALLTTKTKLVDAFQRKNEQQEQENAELVRHIAAQETVIASQEVEIAALRGLLVDRLQDLARSRGIVHEEPELLASVNLIGSYLFIPSSPGHHSLPVPQVSPIFSRHPIFTKLRGTRSRETALTLITTPRLSMLSCPLFAFVAPLLSLSIVPPPPLRLSSAAFATSFRPPLLLLTYTGNLGAVSLFIFSSSTSAFYSMFFRKVTVNMYATAYNGFVFLSRSKPS
jgi:serine/threonine protein kinase